MKMVRFTNERALFFNDKASKKRPIILNTTGVFCARDYSFETHNSVGRRDYFLIYVTKGELYIRLDNLEFIAKKGSLAIIPPNTRYFYSASAPINYFYAHFTGSYVEVLLKDCLFDPLPFVAHANYSSELVEEFNKLTKTFLFDMSLSSQKCAHILEGIIISLAQGVFDASNSSKLKKSIQYIHDNYSSRIDIPSLAIIEGLSASRYMTVFKKLTGKSPSNYIIDLRIDIAQNLLSNSTMSIKQVAESVGYHDPYFFSRIFKERVGLSPAKFREQSISATKPD